MSINASITAIVTPVNTLSAKVYSLNDFQDVLAVVRSRANSLVSKNVLSDFVKSTNKLSGVDYNVANILLDNFDALTALNGGNGSVLNNTALKNLAEQDGSARNISVSDFSKLPTQNFSNWEGYPTINTAANNATQGSQTTSSVTLGGNTAQTTPANTLINLQSPEIQAVLTGGINNLTVHVADPAYHGPLVQIDASRNVTLNLNNTKDLQDPSVQSLLQSNAKKVEIASPSSINLIDQRLKTSLAGATLSGHYSGLSISGEVSLPSVQMTALGALPRKIYSFNDFQSALNAVSRNGRLSVTRDSLNNFINGRAGSDADINVAQIILDNFNAISKLDGQDSSNKIEIRDIRNLAARDGRNNTITVDDFNSLASPSLSNWKY